MKIFGEKGCLFYGGNDGSCKSGLLFCVVVFLSLKKKKKKKKNRSNFLYRENGNKNE